MDFTFNAYSYFLIFFGAVTLFLSWFAYRKDHGAVRLFGLVMLSYAIWSLGYGFELACSNLKAAKLFIDIEYIGITTVPLYWLLFCLKLSGKEYWYKRTLNLSLLISVTAITSILVWTNDYHHLHYKHYFMDTTGPFPMVSIEPGITYKIFTAYFYVLLAIGSYLLITTFRKADSIYKRQNYSIIIAALIPWITNIAYTFGFRPVENLDLTPFAFAGTITFVGITVYRYKLFDVLPVAREKVLELIQDGFLVIDKQYRVIDYNHAIRKYLDEPNSKKIIGASIEALFPEQNAFFEFLRSHQSGKVELRVESPLGIHDLEADILYLNDNQLSNVATVINFQDLTHFKQVALTSQQQTEELKRLNQLKDRIFSIIAHDLRGPLVNLSEVLKMISNDEITIDEFKILSPTLTKDILYTTELLENILHWSRSQLKGYGLNKEYFDLRSMIINEVNYHLPSATSKNVKIIQDVFPGIMVYADMLMIQIVLRNLLSNAIKFCYDGCEINISSVYTKDKMMLTIHDNGVGIKEETVEKLFSGENMSTRGTSNEKGTGLGLVVCREFMERNDGTINVESEFGVGTRFNLFIPVAPAKDDFNSKQPK
ncbi:PAS domain-containing sensor histidine kinase [Pedobacter sp. N36a]|uniref:sensor histidine kinase n=1 Tax=Pedobacter sp. N36a TaxID=2767996 RepID=UPI0016571FA4|nr:histidine kinase N-terminal 7TM domain-containing protein [Pedobacter sp. N36a]MBC8987574.1 PAS domain-containing sensor histidine kinase [Pedobacter sp. N36a]